MAFLAPYAQVCARALARRCPMTRAVRINWRHVVEDRRVRFQAIVDILTEVALKDRPQVQTVRPPRGHQSDDCV